MSTTIGGEWSDTTLHLVGRSDDGHVNFGVALFNGLPQAWAHGTQPETSIIDRPNYLSGSVTWSGLLVGFSGPSPVVGDTHLTVNMENLDGDQDLKFRDLYFRNRAFSSGPDRWFPERNIDYKVEMTRWGFISSSEEEDQIIGAFLGPQHEGMAGTLKRTDLVGAFGGTR